MYLECNCLLNSLIALLFFFSKRKNTVTKNSKILLKYSHFMKPSFLYRFVFKAQTMKYEYESLGIEIITTQL